MKISLFKPIATLVILALALGHAATLHAQNLIASGFDGPAGMSKSYSGHLVVAISGTGNGDGSVELVTRWGRRHPLVSGLPSAIPPEDGVSGPTAVAATLSTVYVLIGEGDSMGPSAPPQQFPNAEGVSSPLFSSVLEMHFDPVPDGIREGFVLSPEDIGRLADGYSVHLTNDSSEQLWVRVLTDFRDFVPDPVVSVRQSNPFSMQLVGELEAEDYRELAIPGIPEAGLDFMAQLMPESPIGRRLRERSSLYIVDAGANAIREVDVLDGRTRVLTRFAPAINPLFPDLGGPFSDPVPFGLAVRGDKLLVSLFGGFPFAPGVGSVVEVDRKTGAQETLLDGLTSPGAMLLDGDDLYVVEFSGSLLAGEPGRLLLFRGGTGTPETVAAPLIGPVGMVQTGPNKDIYISEIFTGSIQRKRFSSL